MSKILIKAQQQPVYNLNGTGTTSMAYVLRPVRYTTMNADDIVNYCVANSVVPKAYLSAAMIAFAKDMGNFKAAEAAEIALEHSLGLTCDPVKGYVQIPCIERCAMYALKAKSAVSLVKLIPFSSQVISFDDSVKTMYRTGKDLACGYKETGEKGLAELLK